MSALPKASLLPVRLSVLIPTVGRELELWNTLEALRGQLGDDEEILIIDQNAPALAWPERLSQDSRIRALTLRPASLTRARNLGMKSARHPFVVFLDDDILPDPELLLRLREAAQRAPDAVWTGTITQADRPAGIQGIGSIDLLSGEIITDYGAPPEGPVPFFAGGLCLLPKHRLGPGPWYSPAFRGAAQGEEIDLALRLRAQGIALYCDPRIRMHHLKAPMGGCRSPGFQQRFAEDEVFNRSLFWGRHGHGRGWRAFLKRLRGFIEFYSRLHPENRNRHDLPRSVKLLTLAAWGLGRGALGRIRRGGLIK